MHFLGWKKCIKGKKILFKVRRYKYVNKANKKILQHDGLLSIPINTLRWKSDSDYKHKIIINSQERKI